MNQKKKEVVLVTGASSGMGKDFAKALLDQNMIVYAAARRIDKMTDLESLGAIPLKMDIAEEADILNAVEKIKENHGGVDVLINNAGFATYGSVEETTIDEARYQFEVNLFGLARLTQLLIPHMREQKLGAVINISSVGGKVYSPLGAWYHATKHALEGWSDCLRLELNQFGVDVVIIEPGAIKTEFADVMTQPMLDRSGHGPYASFAKGLAALQEKEHGEGGGGSPTSVITNLITKAIHARKPKTRYSAGKYSGSMMFIRKWFGDRMFDKVVLSILK